LAENVIQRGLDSTIAIFEADNIVLTQILTNLNLNDLYSLIAVIGQPVFAANGTIGKFAGLQFKLFVLSGNPCHTSERDPVLCPLVVQLQGEHCPGIDHYVLHLIPGPAA